MRIQLHVSLSMIAACCALLTGTATHAAGTDADAATGQLTSNLLVSRDSDHFDTDKLNVGYVFSSGWGLGFNVSHFSAPGWSANGKGLFAQYLERGKDRTIEARLGATQTAGHTLATGMLDYMHRVSDKTWLGVSAERDVVESIHGIEHGMHYDALMLVLDQQFTDRFNVGAVLGATRFSDNNTRPIFRTRWNYELVEGSGLNVYLKTRNYHNNRPYQGHYFAPENLGEYSAGLSWRTAFPGPMVFFASADVGRQRIDSDHNGIWSARIGLQNHHTSKAIWQVALETSNNRASSLAGGVDHYRYTSLIVRLVYPF
ncbi:hypothetical protein [Diaphorobacter caeni]|uniref:hypothetical protein n=1 Tax=Diaphorobacter caeni TaxID=2784387 RepID=UPI00188DF002|nr:hypothetical protein [Diaphorobacter caeni]MBF5003421.1 hypothetical protein [Diaphorobacter caeni]